MRQRDSLSDLLDHLQRTSSLDRGQARRLVQDVVAYFSESPAEFVTRRHRELQARELKNEQIFVLIAEELEQRRFAAPPLSPRQIRRLIYG